MVDPQLGVPVQHAAHLIQWGPCLCALVLMKTSLKLQLQNKEYKCQADLVSHSSSVRLIPRLSQTQTVKVISFLSHMSMACLANDQNKKTIVLPSFNQVHTQRFVCTDSCFLLTTNLSFLAQLHVSTILPSCKKRHQALHEFSMFTHGRSWGISHHVVRVSATTPCCFPHAWINIYCEVCLAYTSHEIHVHVPLY